VTTPGFVYTPPGPVAREFLLSNALVRGIMGAFGSGKSTACVMDILRNAREQAPAPDGIRYSRHLITRQTFPELKTTSIKTWHQWVPQGLGRWVDTGPPRHHIRADGIDIEVLFVALDQPQDVQKALGMELTTAWMNEAREQDKAILDALTARVGRYPGANLGGCTRKSVIMDTNPPDSDHWWYKLAEEQHPEGWEFFSQPSGLSPQAENLNWLNQTPATLALPVDHPERIARGRRYYQDLMQGKSAEWIEVYIHGRYAFLAEGRPVYPEYADHLHCAKERLSPIKGQAMCSLDFGLTPAAVFQQRLPNSRIIAFHELIATDMGITNFARLLAPELAKYPQCEFEIVGDPAGQQRSQVDERTVFEVLRATGLQARPARTNDFVLRRDAVGNALSRLVDRAPAYMVSPTCPKLRRAYAGGYCFRRMHVTEERYRDVPDKNIHSHVAEAAQYGVIELGENPRALITGKQLPGIIHPTGAPWKLFE